MRPIAVAPAVLAVLLLAAQAFASNTIVGNPRDLGTHPRGHITLLGALTLPVGDFGSTTSSRAGFAAHGGGLGVEYSARFPHDIESGVVILVDQDPVDTHALGAALAGAVERDGFTTPPFTVTATNWEIRWGLLKLGFAPQVGVRVRASMAVYGGLLSAHYPEFTVDDASGGGFSASYDPPFIEPAVGFGADVRWHEHATLGLLYLSGFSEPTSRGSGTPVLPVSTLHATLGYAFGH